MGFNANVHRRAGEERDWQTNPLNQYTSIANGVTNTPTYDLDGNLLTLGDWTYAWDGENRLVAASNAASGAVVENAYDYMGRRIRKVVDDGSTVATNTFVYDGWNLIRESSTGVSPVTNHYVWGLDLSGSLQGAGGIGGLLYVVFSNTNDLSAIALATADANGNVSELVNTNGAVVAHYEYDAFGNTTAATGDMAGANPFRFSTKYLDTETGLYYYGYRYYSPELGRWVNRDPIGERGGLNVYGFAGNQPYRPSRPFGLNVYDEWVQFPIDVPDFKKPVKPDPEPEDGIPVTLPATPEIRLPRWINPNDPPLYIGPIDNDGCGWFEVNTGGREKNHRVVVAQCWIGKWPCRERGIRTERCFERCDVHAPLGLGHPSWKTICEPLEECRQ